ncbi:DUF4160 domain-containing protein [Paraburkholderia sp. Ac-20340]|nr:DUF4160 domain-containing protein [Paraburkholderia sp. Ac-20340]
MPIVLRVLGARVRIHSNDHDPPHIHVETSDGECVLNLNCPHGPPVLRDRTPLTQRVVRRFLKVLEPEVGQLCWHWKKIEFRRSQTWSSSPAKSTKPPDGREKKFRSRLPRTTTARIANSKSRTRMV